MASEITDAVRFVCIGLIGWTVSFTDGIEAWARLGIALATAGYMTGKCIVIWSKIIKGNSKDEKGD